MLSVFFFVASATKNLREMAEKVEHEVLMKHKTTKHHTQYVAPEKLPIAVGIKANRPASNLRMTDVNIFLKMLERNIPFSYSHFNDGEIRALECARNDSVDFGRQQCSEYLSAALSNALTNRSRNFYVGIPCLCEFEGRYFRRSLDILNITLDTQIESGMCPTQPPQMIFADAELKNRLTVATVFINGNYRRTKAELTRILFKAAVQQERKVHVIASADANPRFLPFFVSSTRFTPSKHSFDHSYSNFRTEAFLRGLRLSPGDIVLAMSGPLGRILVAEWSKLRDDVTFIDMGSFWDAEFYGKLHHDLSVPHACMFTHDDTGFLRAANE